MRLVHEGRVHLLPTITEMYRQQVGRWPRFFERRDLYRTANYNWFQYQVVERGLIGKGQFTART